MTSHSAWPLFLLLALLPATANARVVINEVLYNAPDDLEDLEYIELHNSGDQPVDLSGWKFTKGIKFAFAPGTVIGAKGFLVLCRNRERFQEFYEAPVLGTFDQKLSNKGERLELSDAADKIVDTVKYEDGSPWPLGADGLSGSLERISPEADGQDASNWVSSSLSADRLKPAGTPGQANASYSAHLPPTVTKVRFAPENPNLEQPITVEADVKDPSGLNDVKLLYRLAGPGFEKPEVSLPMQQISANRYTATIPGQAKDQLIRFRIQASGKTGALRFFPAETEPRPALSAYVHGSIEQSQIPLGWIIDTTEAEFQAAQQRARSPGRGGFFPGMFGGGPRGGERGEPRGRGGRGGPGGFNPDDMMARFRARALVEGGLDLQSAWFELTVQQPCDLAMVQKLKPVLAAKLSQRDKLIDETLESPRIEEKHNSLPEVIKTFQTSLAESLKPFLTAEQNKVFADWLAKQRPDDARGGMLFPNPSAVVKGWVNLEAAWYAVTVKAEIDEGRFGELRGLFQELSKDRDGVAAQLANLRQLDDGFRELRERGDALDQKLIAKLKPMLSPGQRKQFEDWQANRNPFGGGPGVFAGPPGGLGGPQGGFGDRGGGPGRFGGGAGGFRGGPFRRGPTVGGSFRSAFVYYDPGTQRLELFDFVQVVPRGAGQKVHFYKDKPLNRMTTINLIFENEGAALAEPLAFEAYRRAGVAAPQSHHVRLSLNGQSIGYYLLNEQVNRAFLRRNKIADDGNLYKLLWYERGVVGQHEKKTNTREGHDDIVALIDALGKTEGDEQWGFIKKNFDVEQMVNYFAVSTALSNWDGFFNNYFAYHDVHGTGKWRMFPWDEDQTWGITMGFGQVFYTMPITFGMNGDVPPGQSGGRGRGFGFGFGGGAPWWRAPGYFSGPLLANPQFRKLFLARTKEILESIYTEEIFVPIINAMGERLKPEVQVRAAVMQNSPERAMQSLEQMLQAFREHVKKRREFLLAQDEIKNAGKFSRDGLGASAVSRP